MHKTDTVINNKKSYCMNFKQQNVQTTPLHFDFDLLS